MKRSRVSKFLLSAAVGTAALALPSAALASSISGTVTAVSGGAPIPGVEVCFTPQPYNFEVSPCAVTGPTGQYRYEGLPGGNYIVYFSTDRANLKYASEYYDDKAHYLEAGLFPLGAAEDKTLNAELAEGGSISGTVTDEAGVPIAGVGVCASEPQGDRCSDTDASGKYQINGLRPGEYRVEYEGGNNVNYLREPYRDPEGSEGPATPVEVTASTTTPNIDVKMAPGAQILGQVSEVGTGASLANVRVCAIGQAPVEFEDCASTDSAGNYALRSLPAATYLVSFDVEYAPISHAQIFGQWWQGASTVATATPIAIKPPETRTKIDGQLPPRYQPPRPEPLQVTLLPVTEPAVWALHCKKHFRKKFVKGKQHCVKIHKKRHHHRHGHGPHAHATGS